MTAIDEMGSSCAATPADCAGGADPVSLGAGRVDPAAIKAAALERSAAAAASALLSVPPATWGVYLFISRNIKDFPNSENIGATGFGGRRGQRTRVCYIL